MRGPSIALRELILDVEVAFQSKTLDCSPQDV